MPSSSSRYRSNVSAEHSTAVAAAVGSIHRPVVGDHRNPAAGIHRRNPVEGIRHRILVGGIHHLVDNLADTGAGLVGRNLLRSGLHLRRTL